MAAYGSSKLWEASGRQGSEDASLQIPPWHSIGWQVYFDTKLVSQWEVNRSSDFVRAIVDSMLIAHGPPMSEKPAVYETVLQLKPAEGGGWFLVYWLDLFAKALLLLLADIEDRDEMDALSSVTDTNFEQQCCDFQRLERMSTADNQEAFATPVNSHVALKRFYKVCRGVLFSVSLELMDPSCSPALLAEVVRELNGRGIHVAAVSSFDWTQTVGIGLIKQSVVVGDQAVATAGPVETKMVFSVNEIERAIEAGRVKARDNVLFNIGSLVSFRKVATGRSKQRSYSISTDLVATLRQLKARRGISLGAYVDECTLDQVAASLVVSTVNRYADVFDLGMAWAGVSSVMSNLMPSLRTVCVGVDESRHREHHWEHCTLSRLAITVTGAPDMAVMTLEAGPHHVTNPLHRAAWEEPAVTEAAMVTSNL